MSKFDLAVLLSLCWALFLILSYHFGFNKGYSQRDKERQEIDRIDGIIKRIRNKENQ